MWGWYMLSTIFLFFSLNWVKFLGFWLCLEMSFLFLMPCFFNYSFKFKRYYSMLKFVVISSLSSILLVSGLFFNQFNWLILMSLLIKVGSVPFYGWLVYLISNVSWGFMFVYLVMGKLYLMYFFNIFFSHNMINLFIFFAVLNYLMLPYLLFKLSYSFNSLFLLLSINSSMFYMYLLFFGTNLKFIILYSIYFICSGMMIVCFSGILVSFKNNSLMLFFIVSVPFSLLMMYKMYSLLILVSFNSFIFLIFWVYAQVMEQVYVTNLLVEKFSLKMGL